MKQKNKSILEAIISLIVGTLLYFILNDIMLKYGLPIVFLLLTIYKINESIEYSKK